MSVASINVGFQVNVKELSEKLSQAATELEKSKEKFQSVGNSIGQAGMYIGRYVDQMAGTVVSTIGGVVTFIPEIISGFAKVNAYLVANPWVAVATAITAAGTALYFYTKKGNEAAQTQKMLNDVNAEALKNTAQERAELDSLVNVAKDVNALKEDRLKAIRKLNEISPKYLGDISLETINTNKATEAIGKYIDALNSKAKEQAMMAKKTELFQKQMEIEMKSYDSGAVGQGVFDKMWSAFGVDTESPIIRTREELDKYVDALGVAGDKALLLKKQFEPFFIQKEKEIELTKRQIKTLDEYAAAERSATDISEENSRKTIGYYEEQVRYFQKLQKEAAVNSYMYKLYQKEIDKAKAKILEIDGVTGRKKEKESVNIDTIKYYESQISALKKYQQEEALTVDEFNSVATKIEAIQQKIDSITGKRDRQDSLSLSLDSAPLAGSTAEIEKQIGVLKALADERRKVFGEADVEYQALKAKISDLEFEIKVKVDDAGFALATDSIDRLKQELELQGEMSSAMISAKQDEAQMYANIVGDAFGTLSMNMVNSMGEAESGLERFGQSMAGVVLRLIAMALSNAMANAIVGATQSGNATGPGAVFATPAFIATAIAGIFGAFASIPKFADGGVVFGPTLGLMGEYAGASSNPEVIAPLNKLKEMITPIGNSAPIVIGGNIKLRGRDLELVLDRNDKRNSRTR